jgi:5,10-methylenetetrahydrofolate reductase
MILNSRNSAEIMERRCGIRFPEWFKEELGRGNWRDSLLTSIREIADICDGVHISPIVEQDFSVLLAEEARKILRDRDEQLPIFLP